MENNTKNLLVSFSGGETSAFMAQWLNNHYEALGYENIVYVFANTGLENEETLEFVQQCDDYFNLRVKWVEAKVIHSQNKGTTYYLTDFDNAKRNGEPFEDVISKYGIPNIAFPHCSRELKKNPIHAFGKDYFNGEKYDTAIGIRLDEFDRVNLDYKKLRLIYPLVQKGMMPTKKPVINLFWKAMPFRLNLKGYQGNCTTCWKKSDKKLYQIAKETPTAFDFFYKMERKYPFGKDGERVYFFRENRSVIDILQQSKEWNGTIVNDAEIYNYQLDLIRELDSNESCEVFTEC